MSCQSFFTGLFKIYTIPLCTVICFGKKIFFCIRFKRQWIICFAACTRTVCIPRKVKRIFYLSCVGGFHKLLAFFFCRKNRKSLFYRRKCLTLPGTSIGSILGICILGKIRLLTGNIIADLGIRRTVN